MKYFITGGAGFIGSHFVNHILETQKNIEKVTVFDKFTYAANIKNITHRYDKKLSIIEGDICDFDQVSEAMNSHDIVVHFAAESHVDRSILGPGAFVQTNVVGTFTLLESFRQHWLSNHQPDNYRFLHVATHEVYGRLGVDDQAVTEPTPYATKSPFSASKTGMATLASRYFNTI